MHYSKCSEAIILEKAMLCPVTSVNADQSPDHVMQATSMLIADTGESSSLHNSRRSWHRHGAGQQWDVLLTSRESSAATGGGTPGKQPLSSSLYMDVPATRIRKPTTCSQHQA